MKNPEVQAYLLFLEYILEAFNKYNAYFQAQETRVHSLQSAAENFLKNILRNVVKAPLLNYVGCGTIDPLYHGNRLFPDRVIVGEACQDLLDRLNQEGKNEIVQSVYTNCLAFYNIAATEIRRRLFVKEEFLGKLKIFDPKFALQQDNEENRLNNSVIQDVLLVAKRLGDIDEEMLQKEWQSLYLDFALEQKQKIINLSFDDAWKTILATKAANGEFKYRILTKLINTIRSLPNSNADAERVFSMLTDIKTKKRNKLNPNHVKALCVLKSTLKARGQTAQTMTVDARHLALMTSENLYQRSTTQNVSFLRLFPASECPSTSSAL